MAMSNQEKIEWFDKTMDWVDQWGSSENARNVVDYSDDAAMDLFFDVVNQYKKDRGK